MCGGRRAPHLTAPQAATPKQQRVHNGLKTLLEWAVVQQAESAVGRRRLFDSNSGGSQLHGSSDPSERPHGSLQCCAPRNADPAPDPESSARKAATVHDWIGPDRNARWTLEARSCRQTEKTEEQTPPPPTLCATTWWPVRRG